MVIGVNALSLKSKVNGIGKYTVNLLNKISEISHTQIVLFTSNRNEIKDKFNPKIKIVQVPMSSRNGYFRILGEQLILPSCLKKHKVDILFCPFYTSPFFSRVKKVITVHDMIYKKNSDKDTLFSSIYRNIFFSHSIKKADKIITVSQYTKRDILNYYPRLDNINVVYLGTVDYESKKKIRPSAVREDEKFILTVGSVSPRKNNLRVIKALEMSQCNNMKLVIAGNVLPKQSSDVIDYIKEKNLSSRVIVTGYLSDEELAWCYDSAQALMYCSTFEGFGLPPFEAMKSGTPVVASNVTSIPEVVGEAALLVNPVVTEEISSAIARITSDDNLRNDLINKGYLQYKKFNWDNTAKETLRVFQDLS